MGGNVLRSSALELQALVGFRNRHRHGVLGSIEMDSLKNNSGCCVNPMLKPFYC